MPHVEPRLFNDDNPVAARQPKTDRLVLDRLLTEQADSRQLDREHLTAAHAILIKWADLESSGRLARLTETQLQGDFLGEVFGQALGYARAVDHADAWHLEQHHTIAGQTPDAVLGHFQADKPFDPLAVIELKGPSVHPDRDRSNGRTAVDQCWDYLVNTPPTCRWGIVSNMVSFRLYERDSTKRAYEHFSLQSLRDEKTFRKFYVLFHRKGLIEKTAGQPPRAVALLKTTDNRQREVSDKLYDAYSHNRTQLISHLHFDLEHPLDHAIEMAQRLFDRIMFIAFCEDRGLLPGDTIKTAYKSLPGFSAATNPRWQNFKSLFRFVDAGSDQHHIPPYNGGLFAAHAVDDLELPDEPYTNFFHTIGSFDFSDEVNLDVLGHLFEKSITELEKLKASGLFGGDVGKAEQFAAMPQSAKRKKLGIYYTPTTLTSRIVQYTVDELIAERFANLAIEHGVAREQARRGAVADTLAFWQAALDILRDLKIVDPACGSGAFLFQAYDTLEHRYAEVIDNLMRHHDPDAGQHADAIARYILNDNLYGVDLSPEAVEITQLALWIRSATAGQTLEKLSANIVHGNSLVHDPDVHPAGFDWAQRFPEVFSTSRARQQAVEPESVDAAGPLPHGRGSLESLRAPGFDCVIGNPPWERIKLQEREFFSLPAPEIATATNAAKRRKHVEKLKTANPELYRRYVEAQSRAGTLLDYCRKSKHYPLTGKGDINTYAVFAELASQLVAPNGRVGLLTPSGIASDMTTKDFFAAIAESDRLIRLYDFENKKIHFPEVHASFKFCILNFGGSKVTHDAADFIFFAHHVEDLEDAKRHVKLSGDDIKLLNPNTRTCPIFRTRRDAEITKAIYRRVPVLIDRNRKGPTGNPWGIKFNTMFHQTNDAELFREADWFDQNGYTLDGNRWVKGKQVYLPVYEAKMFRNYDHRHGTVFEDTTNWINQGQTHESTPVQHQNPEYLVLPRWWVSDADVNHRVEASRPGYVGFRDVTRATDWRTFIATFLPYSGLTNKVPLLLTNKSILREACLLADVNSIPHDFCTKQKFGGISLNFFIVEQLPTLPPDTYDKPCPWDRGATLEGWISERVLKLTCTAEDMLPLAEACGFASGSFQRAYGGRLNKWDEAERAQLMAELDAAYFILYGIEREDAEYILTTFKGIHQRNPLFAGHVSTAEHILDTYDHLRAMR